MADQQFVLTAPDGSQFNLSVPEGSTQEQIQAKVDAVKSGFRQQSETAQFAQQMDTTPTEPLTRRPLPSFGGFPTAALPENQLAPDELTLMNNAASAGVDIRTGASAGLRARADLLDLNPDAKIAALEYLVSKEYEDQGIGLPVGVPAIFREEFTGQLAFWQPTDKGYKPTLINPPGLDAGDALSSLDDIAQLAVEIPAVSMSAIQGARAGGPILGGAAGAATAGAIQFGANAARKALAVQMGIPQEIADQITSDQMLVDASLAAGFEVMGPVAAGLLRRFRNLNRPLDSEEGIAQLKSEFETILKSTAEIEKQTGVRLAPSLGGATGDPQLLVLEANAKRDAFGSRSAKLREEEVRNRAATGDAIRAINQQTPELSPRPNVNIEALEEQTKKQLQQPFRKAEEQVAIAETAQATGMDEVAGRQYAARWAGVQEDLRESSRIANDNETVAWDSFRKQIEFNPEDRTSGIVLRNTSPGGGATPINAALAQINNESQGALSTSLQSAQQSLIQDLGYREGDDFAAMLAAPELDVNQVHTLLSHLKHQKRKEDAGIANLGWRGNDLSTVIDSIETQLANGIYARPGRRQVNPKKADAIRSSLEAANNATVNKHSMFKTKAVKELFKQDRDGDFLKQPNVIRGLVFKAGDAGPLKEVLDVVGSNRATVAELTDELNILYKQNVLKDGKFSRSQSDAFLAQYDDHIRLLTGGDDTDFISNVADFNAVVKRAEARRDRVQDGLSRVYGRRLGAQDIGAGNVATDMLSDKLSLDQVKAIRNRIGRSDPQLWSEIQHAGLKDIENKLLKSGGLEANSRGIQKLLAENRGRMGEMYGERYVRNLELMQDALSAVDRSKLGRASKVVMNPPWLQVTRSVFGPLSPIQRRITASTRLLKAQRDRSLYDLMTNPERLEQFVKLNRTKPGTVAYIQSAQLAGVSLSNLDEDSQELGTRVEELRRENPRASVSLEQLRRINQRRKRERSAVLGNQ